MLRLVDTSKLNHLKAIPLRFRKKYQSNESREEEKEYALKRQSIKMANKLKVFSASSSATSRPASTTARVHQRMRQRATPKTRRALSQRMPPVWPRYS